MKRWNIWLASTAMLVTATAGAAPAATPVADTSLPPQEVVLNAIEATPEVRAAEAALARAQADAKLRRVGSHEAQLTFIPQRRRIEGGPNFNEWEADLTKGVRWPNKVRLDREIGASGVEAAQLMLADAHHAGARRLLMLWSDWQRAQVIADQQHEQVSIWQRDRKAIARRVELGDAARRDLIAADAALAQARAAALQADADASTARLALTSAFPDLPVPAKVHLADAPPALTGSDAEWSRLIIERSHEIGAADAVARQREAEARRARADRLPDPIVGVRVLNDLGGRERSVGVIVTVPFGVRQRSAQAAAAGADAMAAEADRDIVRRDVMRDARRTVTMARAAHAIWSSRAQALAAARDSANKAERAYALGESGMAEVLAARRVELEAALAERRAAVDAVEAVARVEVDAHELWHHHMNEQEHEEHDTHDPSSRVRLPEM